MNKIFVALFVLFISNFSCRAQYLKGLKYYESFRYSKAIPCFKKEVDQKRPQQAEAAEKLADCYLYIKEYKNAETYYQKALEAGNKDPLLHYRYATVLKNNNKYDEALKEFGVFLALNPNDNKAKNAIKSFKDIKIWQSLPKEYDISNLSEVNTEKSEFCPVVYDHKLVYVSWQKPDLINFEKSEYDGTPFLKIYYVDLIKETPAFKKKPFLQELNSHYHDGPICFSKQNELIITRVVNLKQKKDKAFVNRPQLYIAYKKDKSWGKVEVFPYNNINYSLAHACISDDGNSLFFSSDMPGGYGGMDIWACKRKGSGWDTPVNLGSDINTGENEEFPYIRSDSVLFFSSDGLPGFGGLDVFSAKQIEGKWILNRNEGIGINSLADDFGIYFTDKNNGYISSNRDGGRGGDDIYKFTFKPKLIFIDGTILNSKDTANSAKDLKLILEDSIGNHLNDTRTNNKGYFKFENLLPDNKYMVKIDESDSAFNHQKRYYLKNSKGEISQVTLENARGEKFVFRNLPSSEGILPQLNSPDDINLAGNLLAGENPAIPIANKQVLLKTENGMVLDETTTNSFGAFAFSKLPSGESFLLELSDKDSLFPIGTHITLTDKSGKQIRILKTNGKNSFKFSLLAANDTLLKELTVADADLIMNINGKILDPDKKPITHLVVYLMDEKAAPLDGAITDSLGAFKFEKLLPAKNYIISPDEKSPKLKDMDKIYLANMQGKIIREIYRNKNKGFSFSLLQSERSALKEIYVDDPWIKVAEMKDNKKTEEITIIENVFYALNSYKFDEAGQRVMDKVILIMKNNQAIQIEISSHTDAQGDDKSNLTLSQKRAKYAVDYMVSKGISAKRLKAIGYGESKLINKCGNDVQCQEEEHAKNRRTEFRIIMGKTN